MEFTLSPAQEQWRDAARCFAQQRLAPRYQAREQQGRIEPEVRLEMGEHGFIAPELPAALGGRDLDRITSGLLVEEVARGDFSVAYLQIVGSLVGQILVDNARADVAADWVPAICRGERIVGIGLTEPHAGSDAGMPELRARREGDEYVLNGVKSLSFCNEAAAVVVFARTSEQQRRGKGISTFLVPLDSERITRELCSDMGTKAVGRGEVHLDDVRVPADHLLGEEGRGFTQVMRGFDFSRALIGLQCLGIAQVTVDETWQYVSRREAFDQPLSTFQGVSFPLAESETLLSAARLLCYRTLSLKDQGQPHTAEAAMCKWWAPKTAFDVVQNCLLLHGQYGYRTELPLEQRLRDVLGLQIGDGTAQIMKLVIARERVGRALAP
ncbi:cyclohexanecarboxyl-CoA dehydrogenase [Halopolyspora algeriensis]|uniref:Cyclohexanecarboxyl-CoA dehydrogenase n=1 Tax=Halopolyspora algeriensis TaxID=1500506 RepID=A0A368VV29_9ACTN|nr:acyl-CoA dehydrogenase family protein [Halopolyspora algeriensis]RCW45703.1 cyclohexanecarboxyl-CoA dehydrogenase [Halopolyspora algeriensis]TQM54087.1 cyclohexanecarboxyl-CoA dehydrogenase [Halopolyspora algeriensis]